MFNKLQSCLAGYGILYMNYVEIQIFGNISTASDAAGSCPT